MQDGDNAALALLLAAAAMQPLQAPTAVVRPICRLRTQYFAGRQQIDDAAARGASCCASYNFLLEQRGTFTGWRPRGAGAAAGRGGDAAARGADCRRSFAVRSSVCQLLQKSTVSQDGGNAALARLLDAAAMQPPGAGAGRQTWPDYSGDTPPVHLPTEKDAVRLQVGSP